MGTAERKEREKENRKESIIDAAQRVFFDKGLNLATMDEIAEQAELAKGTLYLYYHSKEDLYLAVMMRGLKILREMFRASIDRKMSVTATLADFSRTYTEFARTHRNFFRMLHFFNTPQFHKQVSAEMMTACDRINQSLWTTVTEVIEEGVREGTIRSGLDPLEVAVMLWTNASALLMRIDSQHEMFAVKMNIDLHHTLEMSTLLMLEAVMTDRGKQELNTLAR